MEVENSTYHGEDENYLLLQSKNGFGWAFIKRIHNENNICSLIGKDKEKAVMKIVNKLGNHSEETSKRIKKEIKAMIHFQKFKITPNLIFYDTIDGKTFYVMEYFEEGDLNKWRENNLEQEHNKKPSISLEKVLNITNQLIEIVSICHEEGWVHRDIKPSNILVCRNDIKICDFGIAHGGGGGLRKKK